MQLEAVFMLEIIGHCDLYNPKFVWNDLCKLNALLPAYGTHFALIERSIQNSYQNLHVHTLEWLLADSSYTLFPFHVLCATSTSQAMHYQMFPNYNDQIFVQNLDTPELEFLSNLKRDVFILTLQFSSAVVRWKSQIHFFCWGNPFIRWIFVILNLQFAAAVVVRFNSILYMIITLRNVRHRQTQKEITRRLREIWIETSNRPHHDFHQKCAPRCLNQQPQNLKIHDGRSILKIVKCLIVLWALLKGFNINVFSLKRQNTRKIK